MEKLRFLNRTMALFIVLTMLFSISIHVFATEETLNEKIENAENGATIILEKDYTENIVISGEKEIILDLNGHTIQSTEDVGKDTIKVEYGSKLTITGDGKIISKSKNGACIFNNGTVTIENGRIEKLDKSYYNITNHGVLTVNGGTVINETEYDGTSHASLVDNGYYSYNSTNERNGHIEGKNAAEPTLTINGGEFDGGLNTIKNDDASVLIINDGTFKNNIQVSVLNWNKATINGGTFEVPAGNDKTTICNAKSVGVDYNAGELTVNGGTFHAEYLIESNNAYGDSVKGDTTIITGGTFDTTLGVVKPVRDSGDYTVTISGGTFKTEPEAMYLAESMQKFEKNGEWLVGEKVVLTLVYDNGTEDKVEEFLSGDKVTLEAPIKENYTFKGWKAGDEIVYEIKAGEENSMILTSDLTLTAQWEENVTKPESGTSSGGGTASGSGTASSNSGETPIENEEVKISFKDIKSGDWYYEAVKDLVQKNVIKGISEDGFAPKATLTRGMLITMIHRLEKEVKASKKAGFKDVDENGYYAEAISWAYENKIVRGYSEDTFGAEDGITREQVVLILYRYEKYLNHKVDAKETELKFEDSKGISDYAKEAMNWAVENKIIQGRSEKILAPREITSRAEAAVLLNRLETIGQ